MATHGYVRIGLDHFARPDDPMAVALAAGRLARNFQGYTTDQAATLLGFGASAIGMLPQGYVQNEVAMNLYAAAIGDGRLPVSRGIALSQDDALRRTVIERLMCDLAADLDVLARGFGRPAGLFADELAKLAPLAPLARDGLVEIDDQRVRVTAAGRPFVRLACAVFDRYLKTGKARHSAAV